MGRGAQKKEYGVISSEPNNDELATDTAISLEGEGSLAEPEERKEASAPSSSSPVSISSNQIFGVLIWLTGVMLFMSLDPKGGQASMPFKLAQYLTACALELYILKFWTLSTMF